MSNANLRLFGMASMFLGLVILVLAFVQLGLTSRDMDRIWNPEKQTPAQPGRYSLYPYYPVAAIIFLSLVIMVGGVLGFASPMPYEKERRTTLANGYKVLSLLTAVIFAPFITAIGITYCHLFTFVEAMGKIGVIIAVFSGILMLMSMLVSCLICCYSPHSRRREKLRFRSRGPVLDNYDYGARDYGLDLPKYGLGRI